MNARTRPTPGKTLLAAWRQLCYKLTYHRLFAISLKHWIWAWVVLPPLVAWIGRLSWPWAISLSVLGAAALAGAERARRQHYILFVPAPPGPHPWPAHPNTPPDEDPLCVDQPLLCWASGLLGVEAKERALAGERASISFVRTREHVVMAQVRRTRFLLLAAVSKADVGYWYAFFHPRHVQAVRLGTLYCGFTKRPGLVLTYADEETGPGIRLYLGFEHAAARQRLLDDLRSDVPQEAF
jgi:hypothetical protein